MRCTNNRDLHRTPGSREPEDEETREADHGCGCALRTLWVVAIKGKVADRREDQEANEHPYRPCNERLAATVVLDNVETVEGDAKVDAVLGMLARNRGGEESIRTKIICVTNEFLIPVPAKTTVP